MTPVADVLFFDVVLFFHILAVLVAFGPTVAYGLFLTVAQRDGGRAMPSVVRAIIQWDGTIGAVASLAVLASGLYMAIDRDLFSDFFVMWGLGAIVVILGLVHGVMLPQARKALALAERDVAAAAGGEVKLSDEFTRLNQNLGKLGGLLGLLIVLTLYFMTAKPFL